MFISLNWITATELNNSGFDIERTSSLTSSQQSWQKIGFVSGNGTSTEVHYYSFIDPNPFVGKSYYRLKQIDFDGSSEYSSILKLFWVLFLNLHWNRIIPNPFNPITTD